MRTSLIRDLHLEYGASFGEFAGWEVPMVYTSTIEEHLTVRSDVGIFDISHMGRLKVSGPDATELFEVIYTKRVSKTKVGFMSGPTLALNPYARVKDDEMLYNINGEEWLLIPNAAVADHMMEYLRSMALSRSLKVEVEDLRDKYVMLAIQGPKTVEAMSRLGASWAENLKPLEFRVGEYVAGVKTFIVSRSGWTGEDGFEIIAEPKHGEIIFREAVKTGVKPVGIAARDTLRIEMGFVLGGHEYGEDPLKFPCALSLRYGMGAIDWSKKGFIGEEALRACRREGVRWIRVGLVMRKEAARIIPRHGHNIYLEDINIGWVTSGTYSPILERGIAQAYIDSRYALIGETVELEVRGSRYEARIVDFPFIKR
ncbi:MAG: glycine cleavage system aminomethyltransferase GcvT [Acidilobaceae archaeon]